MLGTGVFGVTLRAYDEPAAPNFGNRIFLIDVSRLPAGMDLIKTERLSPCITKNGR